MRSLLARQKRGAETPLSSTIAQELKKYLNEAPGTSMKGLDDWIRHGSKNPQYKALSSALKTFLLLVANEDAIPSPDKPGFVEDGTRGSATTLSWSHWTRVRQWTIEHIAPQVPGSLGYEEEIYSDDLTVHSFGNLTLVPRAINTSLGNRPWSDKRKMYEALSSTSVKDLETRLVGFKDERGNPLSDRARELIEDLGFVPHTRALGSFNGQTFTASFLRARSMQTCERIWTRLAPWLGWS